MIEGHGKDAETTELLRRAALQNARRAAGEIESNLDDEDYDDTQHGPPPEWWDQQH